MSKKTLLWLVGSLVFCLVLFLFLTGCPESRPSQEESRENCLNLQRENTFWRVMRGEDIRTIPESPEKALGAVILSLLSVDQELMGLDLRQMALNAFNGKSGYYLSEGERLEAINTLAESESPGERLDTIKRMLRADRRASDFLEKVLNDEKRMGAFFRGEKIPPLETPPCCTSYLRLDLPIQQ